MGGKGPFVHKGPLPPTQKTFKKTAEYIFYERETVLENGSPSPPRAPPLPSQNFCSVTVRYRAPHKTVLVCHVPRRYEKTICRFWLACNLAAGWMSRRLTPKQVKFLGGWGVWGEGTLCSQRVPSPHKKLPKDFQKQSGTPLRASEGRSALF